MEIDSSNKISNLIIALLLFHLEISFYLETLILEKEDLVKVHSILGRALVVQEDYLLNIGKIFKITRILYFKTSKLMDFKIKTFLMDKIIILFNSLFNFIIKNKFCMNYQII